MSHMIGTVSHGLPPASRLLKICLRVLFFGLLVLVAVLNVNRPSPPTWVVVGAVVLLGVVYTSAWPLRITQGTRSSLVWLAAVMAAWLLVMVLTLDGIYLVFPLYFLQLFLLRFRWAVTAVAVTTVVAIASYSTHETLDHHRISPDIVVGPVISAGFAIVAFLGYRTLHETRADLAASQHEAGTLAERERLAREIHDTLAQGLSSIQLLLTAADRLLPLHPEKAAGYVRQARQSAKDNLDEARRFVRALTPAHLEGRSLPAALERLCGDSDLPVHFRLSGGPVELPTAQEVALLRIAQSALANVAQHARASRAEVTLTYLETEVRLDVVDDGVGFDPEAPHEGRGPARGGFGFPGMRARARDLGGAFTLESAPGTGTALAVSFPIIERAEAVR